jgi:predicted nucleotidyltransferase
LATEYEDPKLNTICQAIIDELPIKSIIIVGSRATGNHHESSDYDLIVVMNVIQAAMRIKRVKRIQQQLSDQLGISLSINPLTSIQLRRTKGSLFFYKVKKEGVTLMGRNYIGSLPVSELPEMPLEVFMSFLFSIVEKLLSSINLVPSSESHSSLKNINGITISKCILQCGELHLLLRGIYPNGYSDTVRILELLSNDDPELTEISKDTKLALKAMYDPINNQETSYFNWFKCRFHAVTLISLLFGISGKSPYEVLKIISDSYMKKRGIFQIRNLQYFFLVSAIRHQFPWKVILSGKYVERSMRIAMFWLIMALTEDKQLDKDIINASDETLKGIMHLPAHTHGTTKHWLFLRETIIDRWQYSETVLGF